MLLSGEKITLQEIRIPLIHNNLNTENYISFITHEISTFATKQTRFRFQLNKQKRSFEKELSDFHVFLQKKRKKKVLYFIIFDI